ncbi:MAG: OmpA family protein [Chitinispirillaceae bacterium]|nr:OmpA family protein [Chitinispirillaceae bacterium]
MKKARDGVRQPVLQGRWVWGIALLAAFPLLGSDEPCCERPIVNQFGQRGIKTLTSAHTLGVGRVAVGLYGDGTFDQSYLTRTETFQLLPDTVFEIDNPKSAISLFNLQPFIGAGLTDFFDVSLTLPIHFDLLGKTQEAGFGDMRFSMKVSARSGITDRFFDAAFLCGLILPTGNKENGFFPRHLYYFNKDSLAADSAEATTGALFSAQKTAFETHMLLTLDPGALKRPIPLALHFGLGFLFPTNKGSDNALLVNTGFEFHPVRSLALTTELSSEMRFYNVSHGFKMNQDQLYLTPSLVVTPPNGTMLMAGCDFSLAAPSTEFHYLKPMEFNGLNELKRITSGIGPKWRLFVRIGWNGILIDRDRDRDGIYDRRDQCPKKSEDIDGHEDDDGCPDPDNDQDGIPDSLDKCPDMAEEKDGHDDGDGCPDDDNDNDRIPDSSDQCVTAAEDYDGFQDDDGCPEFDNDGDQVPDSVDKCLNIPEDIDGFEDQDGCPDVDNDQDGVPDSLDKCPDQIGTLENGGCAAIDAPKEKKRSREIKRGRVILRGVTFEPKTATIDPTSYIILDELVSSLVDWPDVKIKIVGHTDSQGPEKKNKELSQARADTVRSYLINRGIPPHRLATAGKGESEPIADNASAQGRVINNRIEIRRTDP